MGRTCREIGVIITIAMLVLVVGRSDADVNKDKEECASQLIGLATCLPYVGGQAKAPTLDCCDGLKQVLKDSKKCLCLLVKDRNDPSVGLKFNASLALALPHACHAPENVTISRCIELLHLAPNSPDAKAFADFAKAAAPSSPTPPSTGTSSDASSGKVASDGGCKRKPLVQLALSTIMTMLYASVLLLLIMV